MPAVSHIYFKPLFRGIGQIMLQNNALTGLLFLAGIAVNSVEMFIAALIGLISGHLSATVLGTEAEHRQQGLYGFNGALTGLMICFFWPISVLNLLIICAAAMLTSVSMKLFLKCSVLPPFTAPFILSGWLILLLCDRGAAAVAIAGDVSVLSLIEALFKGLGQVMFQDNGISGLLFLAGLFVASKTAGSWALLATVVSVIAAFLMNFSDTRILSGLYSYNAVLVAVALSANKTISPVFVCLGILLTVLITELFLMSGIIPLTAPFVIGAWCMLLIEQGVKNRMKSQT